MSLSIIVFWLFDVENIRRHDGCNKWWRWLQLMFREGWRGLHGSFDELAPLITQEICFRYFLNLAGTLFKVESWHNLDNHGVSQLIKYPHNETKFDCDILSWNLAHLDLWVCSSVWVMRFAECQIFLFLTNFNSSFVPIFLEIYRALMRWTPWSFLGRWRWWVPMMGSLT